MPSTSVIAGQPSVMRSSYSREGSVMKGKHNPDVLGSVFMEGTIIIAVDVKNHMYCRIQ